MQILCSVVIVDTHKPDGKKIQLSYKNINVYYIYVQEHITNPVLYHFTSLRVYFIHVDLNTVKIMFYTISPHQS